MKRLFYISLALVLITTAGCKRKSEEEVEVEEPVASETEGIFTIPDTPEERGVNMKSSDAELEQIMSGADVEKEDAKNKKKSK